MDDEQKQKMMEVKTEAKLGVGVKIVIGLVIIGAIAAGIAVALMMSK